VPTVTSEAAGTREHAPKLTSCQLDATVGLPLVKIVDQDCAEIASNDR
jgi:hypothetical protein